MITFRQKGDYSKITKYLQKLSNFRVDQILDRYGKEGVLALAASTPIDSGKTASSWRYEITHKGNESSISFHNSNVNDGVNIAVILQYGHGTRNGGYVYGVDYINPALAPIFQRIADEAWKEVTKV